MKQIITSLLENDLYKFNMGHVSFKNFINDLKFYNEYIHDIDNYEVVGECNLEGTVHDHNHKIKLIYSLNPKDISILSTKIGEITEGLEFKFGLMDITCPNKKCRHHVNSVEVELDTILFHKYQQAMNTTID